MSCGICLVTGGTGFIGSQLLQLLSDRGMRVRAMTRASPSPQLIASDPRIEWVIGDITKPDTLEKVVQGIDCVFHLAGYAHAWEEQDTDFAAKHQQVNKQGTVNLLKAAHAAGVKRFVFFSTVKAVADSEQCTDEAETAWPVIAYGMAKREAEEQILKFCQKSSMQAVVLRLSLVYGVGWKGNLAAMLAWIDRGILPPVPNMNNKKSMISVQDVCRAAYLAATVSCIGSQSIVLTDGEVYSTTRIDRGMRCALRRKPPRWSLPSWCWWGLAYLGSTAEWLFRRRFPISCQALHKLFGNSYYQSVYAKTVLGFVPQDTLESVLPKIVDSHKKEVL